MNFSRYVFVDRVGDVLMISPYLPFEAVAAAAEKMGYCAIPLQEWLERNNNSQQVAPQKPATTKCDKLYLNGLPGPLFTFSSLKNIFHDMGLEVVKISLRGRRGPEERLSAEVTLCSPKQASTAMKSVDWFSSVGITIKEAC